MSNVENDKNIRDAAVISAAASVMAVGVVLVEDYRSLISMPRAPYVDWDQEREKFINSILLPSDDHCIGIIRFSPYAFSQLCNTMSQRNLLQPTKHMSVREQLIIFLHILGQNMRFRVVGSCFHRSTETIHRYFLMVLDAVLKLYPHVICQTNSTPPEIRDNNRYYPWFADCIGAVDGTHVSASVPIEDQTRFHGRKGITQNVLAAVSFDLKFTNVVAGWEGSAHDSRILGDVLSRPGAFEVPRGKYYLVDSGYGIRKGFIPPYPKTPYHLSEFGNNTPKNKKELFNLRHSSLRTSVERAFGILKARFRVLGSTPFWSYKIQVDVVLACCVLHNFLMMVDPNDKISSSVKSNCQAPDHRRVIQSSQKEERAEKQRWKIKRDAIADAMWADYAR